MFIIYVTDLSNKNKMQRRRFIFLQKQKIQTVGNREKKFCYCISLEKFFYVSFFRKYSMFRRNAQYSFKKSDIIIRISGHT